MARVLKLEDQGESINPVSNADQMAIVILTAGRGSRMRSELPKVLHPIAGLPMIEHVVRAAESVRPHQIVMVTGPTSQALNSDYQDRVDLAWQDEPLGTGHAVLAALPALLPGVRWVTVIFGDHPLTDTETLLQMIERVDNTRSLVTILAVALEDPGAYARIQIQDGRVVGVLEARDDDTDYSNHVEPVLINSGICCVERTWLDEHLPNVPASPSGEIYLTSLIEIAAQSGANEAVSYVVGRPDAAFGINNRVELADAEHIIRQRINRDHMLAGVTMVDPQATYIEADVDIGQDTLLEPGVVLRRGSRIGSNCHIGTGTVIVASTIGDRVKIASSTVEHAVIDDDVDVGPYAHLRAGTRISRGAHIGNYVETKNASIGAGTAVGHFSYLGDAELGSGVNVGAGTITCNFDGMQKHHTRVGNDVFLGSDTLLVAPVEVGDGSRTGAGSVVTKNVEAGSTVVGVPARLIRRKTQE